MPNKKFNLTSAASFVFVGPRYATTKTNNYAPAG